MTTDTELAHRKAADGFRCITGRRKARSLCTSASIVRAYRRRGRSGRRRKPQQPSESGAHNFRTSGILGAETPPIFAS